VILAATLLRQHGRALADQEGNPLPHLLDLPTSLRVLELGSGTGILPALLFSSTRFLAKEVRWLATDRGDMLQLLNKNLRQLAQRHPATSELVSTELVDWLEVHDAVQKAKVNSTGLCSVLKHASARFDGAEHGEGLSYADLIVAVDCVFNPSLVPAFLDTLAALSAPDRTVSFVLVELREQEMMRQFVDSWLQHEFNGKTWEIWSLECGALGMEGLERGYACFVGYLKDT
jgi:protein N-lysine methyltransferase METTL21D